MPANPDLIRLAEWTLHEQEKQAHTKVAFVPPGDPAAGGGPPGMGGPPGAGGPPPGAGGPPPGMDPGAMGGSPGAPPPGAGGPPPAPPPGGGGDLDALKQMVVQAVQQGVQASAAAPGGAGGAGGKAIKADLNMVAQDAFVNRKLMMDLYKHIGLPLPSYILDGPNRDPSTGLPMAVDAPGSTSNPQPAPQQPGAIQPIQPIQPAMPSPAPPPAKAASDETYDALLRMGRPVPTSTAGSRAGAIGAMLTALSRKGK